MKEQPTFRRNSVTYGGVGFNRDTAGAFGTLVAIAAVVLFLHWVF